MELQKEKISMKQVQAVIEKYQVDTLRALDEHIDGGVDPLWPRLERAATNQSDIGMAAVSRYAIWGNTVRDNIIVALEASEHGDLLTSRHHLIRAANNLAAFVELQRLFNPDYV